MPGIRVSRRRLLQRDGLRQLGDGQPRQHGQRHARADAGDLDQLAEGRTFARAEPKP